MKIVLTILFVCSLTGCFYQSTSAWYIERAIIQCGGVQKIVEIHAHFYGAEFVRCKDKSTSEELK